MLVSLKVSKTTTSGQVFGQCFGSVGAGETKKWGVYISVLSNALTPQNKKVKAKEKDGRIYKYSPIYIHIFI
jgi:hypothetical protein